MATGTKFYLLAIVAAIVISLVILIMNRLDWYSREAATQLVKIQLPNNVDFATLFDDVFVKYTKVSDLISVDSIRFGTLTELIYSIGLKKASQTQSFLADIKKLNGNNKVTLITGYNSTDL